MFRYRLTVLLFMLLLCLCGCSLLFILLLKCLVFNETVCIVGNVYSLKCLFTNDVMLL